MVLNAKKLILCCLSLAMISACSANEAPQATATSTSTEPQVTTTESVTTSDPKTTQPVPDDGTPKAEIVLDETYQTMIGIGGGFTWYSDWMTRSQYKDEMADLLFKDAKLSILRFKNDYNYSSYQIDETAKEVVIYNLAEERANEYGESVTTLFSSWSPSKDLKNNESTKGGGTLKKNADGTFMYDEFGDWWANSVEAYQSAGVPMDYISIQNECDYTAEWDGMELAKFETDTQAEYSKAFLGVYDKLQEKFSSDAPLMIAPETMSFKNVDLKMYVKNILEVNPKSIAGIAHHLYVGGTSSEGNGGSTNEPNTFNQNFRDNYITFGADYPIWQTEFFRGTPLQTAQLISNALVNGNLSSYIHWTGVWEGKEAGNNIISVEYGGDYHYGSVYWVIRHFSEFIRPSYVRTHVKHDYKAEYKIAAFKSPNGDKLAIVIVNPTFEDIEIQIPINGYQIKDSTVYQSVLTGDLYDSGEYYNNLGKLSSDNKITLEAESIITIDISGEIL